MKIMELWIVRQAQNEHVVRMIEEHLLCVLEFGMKKILVVF